jgi:para-aminobenzoate synthetase component I
VHPAAPPDAPGAARPGNGSAWFAGRLATGLVEVADLRRDPGALDRGGWWAVVAEFEGAATGYRFTNVRERPLPGGPWSPVPATAWSTSLDERAYLAGVATIRELVREGEVYQVNLCRVLYAPAPPGSPWGLARRLAAGNPAPYAGVVDLGGSWVVSASPELFLARDGDVVRSGPIKGTAATPAGLTAKDEAENIMITDLVRNDLHRACRPGTVEVESLLRLERHPGLVHLVSTVTGRLRPGAGWAELLDAALPPASVTGAPKSSALRAIAALEPVARGPYCGAVGWVDGDTSRGELAVGIRTFWRRGDRLHLGTGAGITWGSDPAAEWRETELKASRLLAVAAGQDGPHAAGARPADVGEGAWP